MDRAQQDLAHEVLRRAAGAQHLGEGSARGVRVDASFSHEVDQLGEIVGLRPELVDRARGELAEAECAARTVLGAVETIEGEPETNEAAQRFEYEFVRLGEGWLGVQRKAHHEYQRVVHDYARRGWRLVQIFAPGTGVYGHAKYYELVFERPVSSEPSSAGSS